MFSDKCQVKITIFRIHRFSLGLSSAPLCMSFTHCIHNVNIFFDMRQTTSATALHAPTHTNFPTKVPHFDRTMRVCCNRIVEFAARSSEQWQQRWTNFISLKAWRVAITANAVFNIVQQYNCFLHIFDDVFYTTCLCSVRVFSMKFFFSAIYMFSIIPYMVRFHFHLQLYRRQYI